jgi:hypothetical protein
MARNHASALRLVVVPCGCSIIRATALADFACGYKGVAAGVQHKIVGGIWCLAT